MKLSDKPLELGGITVGAAINVLRRSGKPEDAKSIEDNLQFVSDFTNWTVDELLKLEYREYPTLATRFAQLMSSLKDNAINPPTATASESGPLEPDDLSRSGQTC